MEIPAFTQQRKFGTGVACGTPRVYEMYDGSRAQNDGSRVRAFGMLWDVCERAVAPARVRAREP